MFLKFSPNLSNYQNSSKWNQLKNLIKNHRVLSYLKTLNHQHFLFPFEYTLSPLSVYRSHCQGFHTTPRRRHASDDLLPHLHLPLLQGNLSGADLLGLLKDDLRVRQRVIDLLPDVLWCLCQVVGLYLRSMVACPELCYTPWSDLSSITSSWCPCQVIDELLCIVIECFSTEQINQIVKFSSENIWPAIEN